MARASTSPRSRAVAERCWTLVGALRGRIWYARRIDREVGDSTSVRFDGQRALAREERRHDVIGFFHTHPDGPACPSARDLRTMRAWCSSFGKPLLCIIESPEGVSGYRFDDDESDGVPVRMVEIFPRGIVIGVEADEPQASAARPNESKETT